MGGQNAKQIQGESPVQIDHPRFENAKVLESKGDLSMITTMGMEEKQYSKWKQQVGAVKSMPEYLLMPKQHQFSTKGFCGSSGTLTVFYQYFPYLLIEQIQNRKKRKSKFQQCELWFLLFSLSAAQIQMKKIFGSKVGDLRPQNIFINQQGHIKVSCVYSWPGESTNFQKAFERVETLLAPEDMNKLELGGMDDPKNYQSQMFSIGMTILHAAMLTDFSQLYDVKKFKFKFDLADQYLRQWRCNTVYSQIFTAFVSNLCSFEPEKRLTQKELWSWINKYEQEIKNKDDFFIDHAPLKIEKEIQVLRGESNINMLQEPVHMMLQEPVHMMLQEPVHMMEQGQMISPDLAHSIPQGQIPFQEKSIVYPFMQQGLPESFVQQPQMNVQRTIVPPIKTNGMTGSQYPTIMMSPRETLQQHQMKPMMQSIHHNIPTAESMYTSIPAQIMQKQYVTLPPGQFSQLNSGQLQSQFQSQHLPSHLQGKFPHHLQTQIPPGVIPIRSAQQGGFSGVQRIVSPQQQYLQANMVPVSPTGGNFVYTRRIIDPTSNNIVAEERIGEDEYQRGIGTIDQPGDANY